MRCSACGVANPKRGRFSRARQLRLGRGAPLLATEAVATRKVVAIVFADLVEPIICAAASLRSSRDPT
jgi:hypothetical protein